MIFLSWYLSVAIVLSLFKVLMKVVQGFWKGSKGIQLTFLLTLEKNEKIHTSVTSFRISNNFLLCC